MKKRKRAPLENLEVMTVRGVADYLKCHEMTVYRLVKSGELPAFRLGGDWRFLRWAVDKWIADGEAHPSVPESGGVGHDKRGPKLKR